MTVEFSFERRIKAPRSRVFDALTNIEELRDWMSGIVSIERVSETESGPGVRWKETREMFGREATEYIEITDMKRPARLNMFTDGSEGSTGRGEFYFTYWLDEIGPAGAETKLTLECEIRELGWFGELMLKVFSGMFTRSMERDLDDLTSYLNRKSEAAA